MEISLEGKSAIVTGAGPNIGGGIALALAAYGARVMCVDLDLERAESTARRVREAGGEAVGVAADVTDEDAVRGYVAQTSETWGGVDILVNNAAVMSGFAGVLDEDPERFSRAVLVAGLGNLLNTKHVGRAMAERGIRGSIVCVSSSNGWTASAGYIAYAFHKGGVNNFVRAAAMDLAPYGIRVNSYTPTAPTPDNPEVVAGQSSSRDRLTYRGDTGGDEPWRRPVRWSGDRPPSVPMGTTGTPTDIGHCVAWMCSDYARLITGTDFVVDGGLRAKNFAHIPAAPDELAGPAPLVPLGHE